MTPRLTLWFRSRPDESTHIFTTIRAYPVVKKAFLRCVPTAARMGLLVECQDFRGWKGVRPGFCGLPSTHGSTAGV